MGEATLRMRRILIVRLGALGDIVHALPSQQALHQRYPEAQIDWLCEPPYRPLLEQVPGIRQVWTADTKSWRRNPGTLRHLRSLCSRLRSQQYDLALDFQRLLKSALLARLSGARLSVGFQSRFCRERGAALFYQRRLPAPSGQVHVTEMNFALVQALGCSGPPSRIVPLQVPAEDASYVQEQLSRLELSCPVLLNPGAGWPSKLWAPERYARLARRIEKELKLPVLFTYGPGEEPLLQEVERHWPGHLKTFPTTLLQLAALCRKSQLMVASDTGPLHLAVAQGTPTVALMGPTFPWRNGPYCPTDVSVTHEQPCRNPNKRTCSHCRCMDIPVDKVLQAVVRRLNLPGTAN